MTCWKVGRLVARKSSGMRPGVNVERRPSTSQVLVAWTDMADNETVCAAGETAIGDQRDFLAKTLAHNGGGGRQHFTHAGAAFGTLIADHDHVALDDIAADFLGEGQAIDSNAGIGWQYWQFPRWFISRDVVERDDTEYYGEIIPGIELAQREVRIENTPARFNAYF